MDNEKLKKRLSKKTTSIW